MMRQSIALAAMFSLFAGAAWAANAEKASGQRFEPVQVVHSVEPDYPILSVGMGAVILCVAINESGAIDRLDVIHGIPSLTEEAQRVVRLWKFKPARRDGKPVNASITAAFAFGNSWAAGPSRSARPPEEKPAWFKPIRVVSTLGAVYPFASIASGSVTLEVKVGPAGAIDHIKVIHGIPSLTEPAEGAVRMWEFEPAQIDGQPVVSVMYASFIFRNSDRRD